jgi:anti-anti-sigma regulatory factor
MRNGSGKKMKALGDKMEPKPKVMALDLSGVPDLEYTALKMLIEAEKRERQRGVSVWLVGLNPDVLSVIHRSSLGEVLGRERMHFNLEVAVAKYLAMPPDQSLQSYYLGREALLAEALHILCQREAVGIPEYF